MEFLDEAKDLPSMGRFRTPALTMTCGLLAACCALGCRTLESPADLATALANSGSTVSAPASMPTSPAVQELPTPAELRDGLWALATLTPDTTEVPTFRWQHATLDKLLSLAEEERPDCTALLGHDDPVVAANAAILLARSGDATVDRCLVEAVRNEDISLPQRRAALEALAALDGALAGPALAELLDDYGQASADDYSVELHADLLRALSRHMDASASSHFADALGSREAEVRQAALHAYTVTRTGVLPAAAVELRNDSSPRVRAAALVCLAARRHPQALAFARVALADFHLDARLAAIRALGELGGEEARDDLARLLIHEPEAIRSGVVLALAAAGDDVTVFCSANDASWQVRRSVARALEHFPTPRGGMIARQLLADRSGEVRRAVVGALEGWPLPQAGPVLLGAMADAPHPTRQEAADQLARRWVPAREFASEAPADRRAEQLAMLSDAWQATPGSRQPEANSAAAPLAFVDAQPTAADAPAVAQVEGDEVAAAADPEAFALGQLSDVDVNLRRARARQLADLAAQGPLDEATTIRLVDIGMAETDAQVWRELLRATEDDGGAAATRLAYAGASHAAAEVRRLSCGYLAAHSDPRHAAVLVRLLDDPNAAVTRAAVEALGREGAVVDAAPLERLLAREDRALRIAAARALAKSGFDSGRGALVRLAVDPDPEVRLQAVVAMGELGDPLFTATLATLLDDNVGIRLAAVTSLTQIVGHDVSVTDSVPPSSLAEQVQGWKTWWERERNVAETREAARDANASTVR